MRARVKKWTDKELEINEKIIENPNEFKGKWKEYFGNENDIYLEIGCGMGRFVTKSSEANPNINFIALEREKHVLVTGARKAREEELGIAFILGDVADLFDYFEDGEIGRIYINFCDPWQRKKKWAKKCLTHKNFLDMYKKLFKQKGEIFFKTDNEKLFEFSINQFSENGFSMKNVCLDLHNSSYEGNIMTEYEEKFAKLGQRIFRLEACFSLKDVFN